ncbi:MAG: hypothetical protein ACOYOS_12820 [Syntrophales bacterium]
MIVLKMKYGTNGEKVDAFGIRLYGDIDEKAGCLGKISTIEPDPGTPFVIKNKRITLWFAFENIRPCKDVSNLLRELMVKLNEKEYEILTSSLDDLVDTTLPEYAGKPESRFPPYERMVHGYNATSGFSVTAEKNDPKSKTSMAEIEAIEKMAMEFGRIVYGRTLKKIDH